MSTIERLKTKAKLLVKAKKKSGVSLKLKDALNTVAKFSGFPNWRELRKSPPEEDLYAKPTGIFPNYWCKSYEEARAVLEKNGGFLLPYGKQFFVCPIGYLESLGIEAGDSDLAAVGDDFVRPKDSVALARLNAKIRRR